MYVCMYSDDVDILAVVIGESLRLPYYKNKIFLSGSSPEADSPSLQSRSRCDKLYLKYSSHTYINTYIHTYMRTYMHT